MLWFNSSFSIAVCANTEDERNKWVNIFCSAMRNFTVTVNRGGWVDDSGTVVDEPSILVKVAGPDEPLMVRLLILARAFQIACQQQAVWMEFVADGQWHAVVVESLEDWEELVAGFLISDFFTRAEVEASHS